MALAQPEPISNAVNNVPYLAGVTSLDDEQPWQEIPVKGDLPDWLEGTLLRNGPAVFEVGERTYNHWFDGLAMLRAFSIRDGTVRFGARYLRTKSFAQAMESGTIARSEFATDPCRTLFGRIMSIFRPAITDNANINITRLADEFVAMTETPIPVRFDPETLKTLGPVTFDDDVRGDLTTAHPHHDAATGTLYNYLTKLGRTSSYRLFRIDSPSRKRELIASLEVDRPAYMHSFGLSERYLIVTEFPFVVNPLRLAFSGKPFITNYQWQPERGTRFHVFDRDTGKQVGTWEGLPCFAFHHVNAFEMESTLYVDIATYPDARIVEQLYLENLREGDKDLHPGKLHRFALSPHATDARREVLSEVGLELPRINYARRNGLPYTYVWGAGNRKPGHFTDQLVKIDVRTGEAILWYEEGTYPGEPVFVSRPDAAAEDDGLVLSVVLDAARDASFLLVLDARSLTEIARARVPVALPFSFHGQFLRNEEVVDLHR